MKPAAVQANSGKKQNNFTICKVCGQQLKRLTNSHLKRHGLSMVEYIQQHEPEKAQQQLIISFLNEFYITTRSRWLEYKNGEAYTVSNRAWKLKDSDLAEHLNGAKGLGVYFPQKVSNLIGLDIDELDSELLNKVYGAVRAYGVDDSNILISFSGSKGYHLDIFIAEAIDKLVINQFYQAILYDIDATPEQVELFGGGGQAYKLPLGYHYKTGAYCCQVDQWGREISFQQQGFTKLDPRVIYDAVDINYIPDSFSDLKLQYEDLSERVELLEIHSRTNELSIKQVESLIDSGVHEKGRRHKSIRTVAAYCKDIKGYCLAETVSFLQKWISQKWSRQFIGAEWLRGAEITARSVYRTRFKFRVHAESISITLPEIREIFSLKTGNKLQTEALRRLYYILLLHSKAYPGHDGAFFMSYRQMRAMGAKKNPTELAQQVRRLAALGKLMIVKSNQNAGKGSGSTKFKRPNTYKLTCFESYEKEIPGQRSFNICGKGDKCKDCLYNAVTFLTESAERKKHIKGKRFKDLQRCDYNQMV